MCVLLCIGETRRREMIETVHEAKKMKKAVRTCIFCVFWLEECYHHSADDPCVTVHLWNWLVDLLFAHRSEITHVMEYRDSMGGENAAVIKCITKHTVLCWLFWSHWNFSVAHLSTPTQISPPNGLQMNDWLLLSVSKKISHKCYCKTDFY